MSNINNAALLGINAHNEAKQKEVVSKAQSMITLIVAALAATKANKEAIAKEQEKAQALALDVIDQKAVLGTEFTGELNMNQVTILKAIEEQNKARQESVKITAQAITQRIDSYNKGIKAQEEHIAKLRKELNELAADTVTVSQIVG